MANLPSAGLEQFVGVVDESAAPNYMGALSISELEESRLARIHHGNRVLDTCSDESLSLQVLPVGANGECFLRAAAIELQEESCLVDCRLVYILALEALAKQKAAYAMMLGDDNAVRSKRCACVLEVDAYIPSCLYMDSFDVYCLDKLEGVC